MQRMIQLGVQPWRIAVTSYAAGFQVFLSLDLLCHGCHYIANRSSAFCLSWATYCNTAWTVGFSPIPASLSCRIASCSIPDLSPNSLISSACPALIVSLREVSRKPKNLVSSASEYILCSVRDTVIHRQILSNRPIFKSTDVIAAGTKH